MDSDEHEKKQLYIGNDGLWMSWVTQEWDFRIHNSLKMSAQYSVVIKKASLILGITRERNKEQIRNYYYAEY